ncbi:MAG TPA: hypothetical protein VJZ91_17110 [Blastocatellia bacterium]|nr:hypothetical protein [Blastocatellia bacterium]
MQTSEEIVEQEHAARPAPPLTARSRLAPPKPVELAIAFAVIFAVMSVIEFGGPAILDNDGFYHMRWSRTLREQFPRLPRFQSLPLTTLDADDYVDHHYLFHVLLMPFTFGRDMVRGAKWAAVTFSSLGILSLFGLLLAFDVRYRWLWLAPVLASSEPFLYRMSMTRAPALSLGMIGLGAYLILKRKYGWLALLSFAFVWYYSLFPLIFILAALYSLTVYLAERRIEWRAPLSSLAGIVAGLVLNPYFPKNLRLLWEHFLMKATAGSGYSVDVGVEWYPYEAWDLLRLSGLAFVIFFAGLAAFEYRRRGRDLKPLFFLLVSLVLLLMLFKSRRFVEYWPPFAVLFAAFTISPRLAEFDRSWFARRRERVIAAIAAAVTAIIIGATMIVTVGQARADMKAEANPYDYKGASEWIAANVPAGAMIFNTDWDDFPMLYYYNPNNPYIVGLDPTYLYDRDPELWKLYARITLGDQEDPADLIRERFGAEYVFTDNQHPDFMDNAISSGKFETVYTDAKTTVLRIRSAEEIRKAEEEQQKTNDADGDDGADDTGAE